MQPGTCYRCKYCREHQDGYLSWFSCSLLHLDHIDCDIIQPGCPLEPDD